jgi:hypothetical protein
MRKNWLNFKFKYPISASYKMLWFKQKNLEHRYLVISAILKHFQECKYLQLIDEK